MMALCWEWGVRRPLIWSHYNSLGSFTTNMATRATAMAPLPGPADGRDACSVAVSSPSLLEWPVPLSPMAGEEVRQVELQRALVAEAASQAGPAFLDSHVVFEDPWLLVINKPPGVYSGHVLATATERISQLSSEEMPHIHLGNRLDRDTSGILVITKCRSVAGKLTRMFERRQVKKSYVGLCIASGPPSWGRRVVIQSGHGRSRWGAWRVYAKSDVGRKLPENASIRDMATEFTILSINGIAVPRYNNQEEEDGDLRVTVVGSGLGEVSTPPPPPSDLADCDEILVRAHPATGRTHQIRLHCQFLGIPLRGDVKYGGPLVWKGVQYDGHSLHAESMTFKHPTTNEELHLVAPLPIWASSLV